MIPEDGTYEQLKACLEQAALPLVGERWAWIYKFESAPNEIFYFNVLEIEATGWIHTDFPAVGDRPFAKDWMEAVAKGRLRWVAHIM